MTAALPRAPVRLRRAVPLLLLLPIAGAAVSAAPAPGAPPTATILRPPAWVTGPAPAGAAPAAEPLHPSALSQLFARLAAGDRQWLPVTRRLPDGRVLLSQRRLAGDPAPTPGELEAMLRNPPTWARERAVIARLLARLRRFGITVMFEPLISPQAGGQWTPRRQRLSLSPDLPEQGTRLFALVLNHEAIHVAQSCAAGGFRATPRPLALGGSPAPSQLRLLDHPLYRRSAAVQAVEREALAHQQELSLGLALLERHCAAAAGSPGRLAG